MQTKAALFSGQGSQFVAMGKDLIENNPKASEIFDKASEICKKDLKELCINSSLEELSKTENSQIAIFTLSLAKFLTNTQTFDAVCGFSLGEFSAFVAAGIISFEDGLKLVLKRGELMGKASESSSGVMLAVLGLENSTIEEICKNTQNYITPVNYNCPGQLVIAGEKSAEDEVTEKLKAAGAKRVLPLNVSGAFHTKLMEPAAKEFADFCKDIKKNPCKIPLYTNVTGKILEDVDLASHFHTHMTHPVLFSDIIDNMAKTGITDFTEFGCGKTLCGFVRKINREFTVNNI